MVFLRFVSFILFLVLFQGCATKYENTALKSWELMARGRQSEALKSYEKEVTDDKEKLLRLMDEGILLRTAGQYKESNEKFLAAAKIIELNGYISLGEQVVTVLSNEKQTVYQGEDFEKVLVHLYLGLNFVSLEEWDSALVETRRVNEILFKMISDGKRPYEQNAFAKYLGGVLFEKDKDENNAFVSYKNVLTIDPKLGANFPGLAVDLIRMAKVMGLDQELEEYKKKYGDEIFKEAVSTVDQRMGSVVFLLEAGKSPQKYSSRETHTTKNSGGSLVEVILPVAYYSKRSYRVKSATIEWGDKKSRTVTLNNIEETAMRHLKDRMGRAVAKALLTAAIKTGIAVGVAKATGSKDLGMLAGLALFLASEADTRSWLLLPAELEVAKLYLPPGKHTLKVSYMTQFNTVNHTEEIPVDVQPRKITIIQRRVYD